MKKKVLEITCDRCQRSIEVAPNKLRTINKSGWLKADLHLIGRGGPVTVYLCPIHARPMLKALVKIDPETLEV